MPSCNWHSLSLQLLPNNKILTMKTLQSEPAPHTKPLLRDLVEQLQTQKQTKTLRPTPKQVIINPQELKQHLKQKWRDAGQPNSPFGGLLPLKGKVLDSWQIQHMSLSKRSYSSPKTFKGMKWDPTSRQFSPSNKQKLYSPAFQLYLKRAQEQYQNNLFKQKPRQLFKTTRSLSKLTSTSMKFTASSNLFGCSQSARGGLKSFKSQILLRKKGL